jgi:hypothetical protein
VPPAAKQMRLPVGSPIMQSRGRQAAPSGCWLREVAAQARLGLSDLELYQSAPSDRRRLSRTRRGYTRGSAGSAHRHQRRLDAGGAFCLGHVRRQVNRMLR